LVLTVNTYKTFQSFLHHLLGTPNISFAQSSENRSVPQSKCRASPSPVPHRPPNNRSWSLRRAFNGPPFLCSSPSVLVTKTDHFSLQAPPATRKFTLQSALKFQNLAEWPQSLHPCCVTLTQNFKTGGLETFRGVNFNPYLLTLPYGAWCATPPLLYNSNPESFRP
jgi:hypothetical protein